MAHGVVLNLIVSSILWRIKMILNSVCVCVCANVKGDFVGNLPGLIIEARSNGGRDVWRHTRQATSQAGTACLRKLPLSEKTTTTTR